MTAYLIKHAGLWWRPDACGYTTNILEAGLYSEDHAKRVAAGRREPPDVAVPITDVHAEIEAEMARLITLQVGASKMMAALREAGTDVVVDAVAGTAKELS